jgi:hypothetical protein
LLDGELLALAEALAVAVADAEALADALAEAEGEAEASGTDGCEHDAAISMAKFCVAEVGTPAESVTVTAKLEDPRLPLGVP